MEQALSFRIVASSAILVLLLATACGGGGSSGTSSNPTSAPAAPALKMAFGVKQLQFNWAAVSGASSYKLFVNPDGMSGFTETGGNITSTSFAVEVPVHRLDWTKAQYALEACNSAGCSAKSSSVSPLNGMVQAIGYIKASNTKSYLGGLPYFGINVALSSDGSTLAIGERGEPSEATGINGNQNDTSQPYAGAVYVFTQTNGIWSQQAYVKASNTLAFDDFGTAVTLSGDGNTLAVGADGESSSSAGINGSQTQNCVMCFDGAVYVYTRTGGSWSQQAYIKASNTRNNGYFGTKVSLSDDGNTLAVDAQGESSNATGINGNQNDTSEQGAGAVYIFDRSSGTWSQVAYVKASINQGGAYFGAGLALSGDGTTLAAGAPGQGQFVDPNTGIVNAGAGAAYVFTQTNGVWSQQALLNPPVPISGQGFGRSMGISKDGDIVAIGAPGDASDARGINGDPANTSDFESGAVFVFARASGIWTQQAYIKASNTQANQAFGQSVAVSGDGSTLAAGATGESSAAFGVDGNQADTSLPYSGAAYVFVQTSGQWSQQAYVKASTPDKSATFGYAIALNGDGSTLAVTAPAESSGATGIDGNQKDISVQSAGAAYLY